MAEQGNDSSWQGGCGLYLEPAGIRIRSVQRKLIEPRSGSPIHPEPGDAPPEDEFRGRISRTASKTWRGLRSEIYFWLAVCRPFGAWRYRANSYPP
jgi:hypothetical protein